MQFLYKGFRQNGNHRCYSFDAIEEDQPAKVCVIWVDLSLLTKYQVALQGGPEFCLQLLRGAALEGESGLDQFREYHAGDSDFASIVSERVARAAALAAKRPPRRFVRRPPASSHLRGVGYPAAAGKPQPEPVAPAKKPQKSR
ncbi:MAG: hypothetical protein JO211_07400 [Acidobacteriaceae bacterium]|nr:hypothetical protein [Acidobacteriaceae bacterium]